MKNILFILSIFILSMLSANAFAAEDKMMMQDHEYNLENVVGDATVRGITTDSSAVGHASVSYDETTFALHAEFGGLTDPTSDDFYEGWLVQKSPFMFISTGELKKEDGKYINQFESDIDYTSYDFYVLTLEPNDGDDAPADHIFEGTVIMKATDHMMDDKEKMMESDTMMDTSEDTMMATETPEMTVRKNALRKAIKLRINNLSEKNIDVVLERIDALEQRLPTLNISESTKEKYIEIITVLKEVLLEQKTMMQDTMMEK